MRTLAQLSHIAFLVSSVQTAVNGLAPFDFFVGPADSWEVEGTLEIYVGPPASNGKILLIEPEADGAYRRALSKRGPGLHHIAIDVLSVAQYISEISSSGWLLHPKSLQTIRHSKTAYLARPGFPGLIEIQEKDVLPNAPMFIEHLEMPLDDRLASLVKSLGIDGISGSHDGKLWIVCGFGKRVHAEIFWNSNC